MINVFPCTSNPAACFKCHFVVVVVVVVVVLFSCIRLHQQVENLNSFIVHVPTKFYLVAPQRFFLSAFRRAGLVLILVLSQV